MHSKTIGIIDDFDIYATKLITYHLLLLHITNHHQLVRSPTKYFIILFIIDYV